MAEKSESAGNRPSEDARLAVADERMIGSLIYTLRGRQVMLDGDLAMLYGV